MRKHQKPETKPKTRIIIPAAIVAAIALLSLLWYNLFIQIKTRHLIEQTALDSGATMLVIGYTVYDNQPITDPSAPSLTKAEIVSHLTSVINRYHGEVTGEHLRYKSGRDIITLNTAKQAVKTITAQPGTPTIVVEDDFLSTLREQFGYEYATPTIENLKDGVETYVADKIIVTMPEISVLGAPNHPYFSVPALTSSPLLVQDGTWEPESVFTDVSGLDLVGVDVKFTNTADVINFYRDYLRNRTSLAKTVNLDHQTLHLTDYDLFSGTAGMLSATYIAGYGPLAQFIKLLIGGIALVALVVIIWQLAPRWKTKK